MKKAIVTGTTSGIGKAIKEALGQNGYEVFEIQSRLQDLKSLEKEIAQLLQNNHIDLLVNNAGVGVFEPHEELSIAKIKELVDVNLTAPLVLSNLLLRSLKQTQGHIINITSIEATKHSKFSALYTATKSGLRDFGLCLFEELRKSDVRVTNINPDITKTNFFDEFRFCPSDEVNSYLLPQTIAKTVIDVINTDGVITDLTIRPQRFHLKKK
ncbi:MAG: SDR family NAD(P)-dependent oxidoreductase [Campylobacterales bacterium]|nr:SDR family NAD(P)-dependent oxidoreductase [Campylobacterales bacterium]